MTTVSSPLRRVRALSAACALVAAAAHAERAAPPAGFGVEPRGTTVVASYSVMEGESPDAVDRGLVEHTCALKREAGATRFTPVFEPGTDRPVSVRIEQIVAPTAWASYETLQGPVCDPSTLDASRDLCSCTFRTMTSRFVHIRKAAGQAAEVIDVDLVKGTGTRRTRNAPYHAETAAPDPEAFGPVVGHDVVAGLSCSIRRRDLGTSRTELCLADRTPSVPAALQERELAKTVYALDGARADRREWRRVQRIAPDADIDAGVFDPPHGVSIRNLGPATGASR
jgi:hypothetical protein